MRTVFASFWTVAIVGLAFLGLHVWWFLRSDHQADVLAGGGALLGALGIWVAARPYIRLGLKPFIYASLTQDVGAFVTDPSYDEWLRKKRAEELPGAIQDAYAERVVAVLVIMAGAALNGYASALARLLSLRDIAS